MDIMLVDDNKTFRDNLKLYLEGHLNHTVVGEASNGSEFLLQNKSVADIILMDINMPEIGGLDAAKKSSWMNHNIKIIAVSQYQDSVDLQELIGVGFRGFVSKTNLFDELENALHTVMEGGFYFPSDIKLMT